MCESRRLSSTSLSIDSELLLNLFIEHLTEIYPDLHYNTHKHSVVSTESADTRFSIRINKRFSIHLISHLTQADVSSWSDFESVKSQFNIINGSLVSIGAFSFYKTTLYLRDTMLLTPANSKSLAGIGDLYADIGGPSKIRICSS